MSNIEEMKSLCTEEWGVEDRNHLVTLWCANSRT